MHELTFTDDELALVTVALGAFGGDEETLVLAILALASRGLEPKDLEALRDKLAETLNPAGFAEYKAQRLAENALFN